MRFYDVGNTKQPSVTTINDVIDKASLRKYYGTQAARRAVENLNEISERLKADGKLRTVEWISNAANDNRDNAAARGTRVHKAVERHIGGATIDESVSSLVDARERGMFDGYLAFRDDYEVEFVAQELAVCSQAHGWAGRYDAAIRAYGTFGEAVVADWKTGNTGPHSTWALQLAAYASATEMVDGSELPKVSKVRALAVRLFPGSYSTHWLDGQDGRPSIKELYMVFRAARVVWDFEQQGRLWN